MYPVRTCVGCRQRGDRADLIRIINSQGFLKIDTQKSHPGRGSWLHSSSKCLGIAVERSAFGRALKAKMDHEQIEELANFIEQAEKMLKN
ncbi:MAG: YlxR family protein [Micrococcales bacterium]|jgi:hypothetical protein|nr:YlxR family protein [Actinomycetota bacterium]NCA07696.1 YlxR family protein [Micrococcales bacterium]